MRRSNCNVSLLKNAVISSLRRVGREEYEYTVFSLDNSSYRYRMLHNPKISGFEAHKINKTRMGFPAYPELPSYLDLAYFY